MDPTVSEWLNLVLRWIHVITGIAWIGASFYFNWLLNHLLEPAEDDPKVTGELWALHAGGFFRVQKRKLPAGRLPEPLHWFKWEAYWTWLSGFALLVVIYYAGADVYLIDPAVADFSAPAAVGIGIGVLVGSWLVYDLIWNSSLAEANAGLATAIPCLLLLGVTIGLGEVFSARGAYIHVGALLGTVMVANVFRIIMPAQRQMVAATERGEEPDVKLTANSELRSLHNNYITLPVLFIMISSHYPSTYGFSHPWLVLLLLFLAGALVRYYFNIRHREGNLAGAWTLAAAAAIVVGAAWMTAPPAASTASTPAGAAAVPFAEVRGIFDRHCVSCHSANPTSELFTVAPKNVAFDTAAEIKAHLETIKAQSVVTPIMPLGNATGMTAEERARLGLWIEQGGPVE